MKIKRSSKTNRKATVAVVLASVLVFTILGGVLWYMYSKQLPQSIASSNTIDYKPATDEQRAGTQNPVTKGSSSQDKPLNTDNNPTPLSNSSGGNKKIVSVSITASNVNSSIYQIRAVVYSLLPLSTNCVLRLTSGSGTVIQKSSTVQNQANIATCVGFDVPTSELSPGPWKVAITLDSPEYSGAAETEVAI